MKISNKKILKKKRTGVISLIEREKKGKKTALFCFRTIAIYNWRKADIYLGERT